MTDQGIPSPSAADPARNRHRDGRAWSKSAVRAILTNPRYTGFQVWNRQRKAELLLDVDDVGLVRDPDVLEPPELVGVVPAERAPAIIDPDTFTRVHDLLTSRGPATQGRAAVRNRVQIELGEPPDKVVRLGATTFYQRTQRELRLSDPAELDGAGPPEDMPPSDVSD